MDSTLPITQKSECFADVIYGWIPNGGTAEAEFVHVQLQKRPTRGRRSPKRNENGDKRCLSSVRKKTPTVAVLLGA